MKTIDGRMLQLKMDSMHELTLINTLPAEYFEDTKIEGAINIPQDQPDFVDRVKMAVSDDKKAEIVVYCANQECNSSTKAAEKLTDAGFVNVMDYEAGAEDWNATQQTHRTR